MIPADKATVRLWRQRTREIVRANPALKRARRKVRSRWRRQHNWSVLRWVVPLFVLITMVAGGPLEHVASFLLLWTVCVFFSRAAQLANLLHNPQGHWLPYHHPIDNLELFSHVRRRFMRGSIWVGVDWVVFNAAWATRTSSWEAWLAVPLVGLAQFVLTLALATGAVRIWPRAPYPLGQVAIGLLFFICLQLYEKAGANTAFVSPLLSALHHATPWGWVNACGGSIITGNLLAGLGLIILVIGGSWLAKLALASLRNNFSLERIFGYDTEDSPSEPDAAQAGSNEYEEIEDAADFAEPATSPDPVLSAHARECFTQIVMLPPGWHLAQGGALERWCAALLSLRQRGLVDFLRPGSIAGFTRGWLAALAALLFCRALQWAGVDPLWTGLIAILGVLLLATPLFGGSWPGLSVIQDQLFKTGLHTCYPIGFSTTAWLMLKLNAFRIVLAAPLLFLAVRAGVEPVPIPWASALLYTVALLTLLLALQPIWVIAAFSKSTNDTSSRWWFTLLICGALVGGLAVLFATGAAVYAAGTWSPLPFCAGLALFYTHGLLLIYGWAWRSGVFDLMANDAR